jgi:solute:Na+ symporter, SSS family
MRIDLIIIGAYLLAMMIIGYRVSDQSRDVEGYTVGNRNMSGWPLGFSVLATFLSSITFLAVPAKTLSQGNWNAFIFGATAPIAAFVAVRYFVPLYRHSIHLSAYELLESRFGYWARAYAAISYIALQIIRIGTVLLLVGLAVEPMLRWDEPPAGWFGDLTSQQWTDTKIVGLLLVSGVVVIIYDVLGGIRAVIWTDVCQVVALSLGALWVLAELTAARDGGVTGFFRDIPAARFDLGQWFNWDADSSVWNWALPTVFVMAIYGVTENMRNYGADQNYVQRMLAASDERNAKKSIWIGALGYQPLNVIFCLIGTGLWLHVEDIRQSGIAATPGAKAVASAAPDQVLPNFIRYELPEAIAGIIIAAILAAAMSTVDSSMNSCSMVVNCDFVKRLRRSPPRLPEILSLRLWTIAIGIVGTGMAAWLYLSLGADKSKTILDVWWQYAGVAGGGLFGLFLLAWLLPNLPGKFALAGVLLSLPVLAWGTLARNLPADSSWKPYECPLHPNLVGFVGTLTVLAVAATGMLAIKAGVINAKHSSE